MLKFSRTQQLLNNDHFSSVALCIREYCLGCVIFSLGYFKSYQRKWPTGDVSQVRPRTGWVFVQDKFGGPGEAAQHSYSAWGPGTLHMNGFHRTFFIMVKFSKS